MSKRSAWHGRLYCRYFFVDVRVAREDGRWSASVETPKGPHTATGRTALLALTKALERFDGMTLELLQSAPADLVRLLQSSPAEGASAD
ncbi:MAG TPA: hypothetical protein VH987_09895 [Candidatus Limnocylindria bacterium]|jgi:hypothetical protein